MTRLLSLGTLLLCGAALLTACGDDDYATDDASYGEPTDQFVGGAVHGSNAGGGAQFASYAQDPGDGDVILDRTLGQPAVRVVNLPSGFRADGFQATDQRGMIADQHLAVANASGMVFGYAPYAHSTDASPAALRRAALLSAGTFLQRIGAALARTEPAVPVTTQGMPPGAKSYSLDYTLQDGRKGGMIFTCMPAVAGPQLVHVMLGAYPAKDEPAYMARLPKLMQCLQPIPGIDALRKRMSDQALAAQDRAFQSNLRSRERAFQAGQAAHRDLVAGFDRANESWLNDFRSSGGYSSGGGAGHDAFIDAMTETERHYDPNVGFEQRLDAGYDRTFTDGQGNWIQTDDAFFDPASQRGDWYESDPY